MRKVTAWLFISLDGVVENPQDWHFPYFNDEMGTVDATLGKADTVLLGRKTYDSFAGAWPARETAGEEDAGMAKALGEARKVVVSRHRLSFTWRNSEQLTGDLVDAVTALKNQPGETNIAMSGSVSIVRQLLAAGIAGRTSHVGAPNRHGHWDALVRQRRAPDPIEADLV